MEGIREWVRAGSWARSLISGGGYMRSIEIPQVAWVAGCPGSAGPLSPALPSLLPLPIWPWDLGPEVDTPQVLSEQCLEVDPLFAAVWKMQTTSRKKEPQFY